MGKRRKSVPPNIISEGASPRLYSTDLNEVAASDEGGTEPLVAQLTRPQGWGVSLGDIIGQESIRLDAEHYDPKIMDNMRSLKASKLKLVPLSDLAEIDLPGQFVRIWAQDQNHGIPYLNATDLMSYAALGAPAQVRYLSKASDVKMDRLIVHEGIILVTCSGTLGRVFEVPKALNGWAGTHDIVRIRPRDQKLKGYIRAYLSSTYAQIQILSHTHGGQIDHVTATQISSCLVPLLGEKEMHSIADQMDKAEQMKQKAASIVLKSIDQIKGVLNDV